MHIQYMQFSDQRLVFRDETQSHTHIPNLAYCDTACLIDKQSFILPCGQAQA
jgi:hypothetical protein